jgi:RND family efflux transporter MFP subunit
MSRFAWRAGAGPVLLLAGAAIAALGLIAALRGGADAKAERPDARRQQLAGVRVVSARRGSLQLPLRAAGVVNYDERRVTDINLKLDGWIRELYVDFTGQHVQKGQPLFAIESSELTLVQTQFLAALRNRDTQVSRPSPEQPDYAERLIDTPRQRLLRLDVPDDQLQLIEKTRQLLPTIVFRSPASGVVVEKSAVKGMHVETGKSLYRLVDLSTVWIDGSFYENDISRLKAGAAATVTVDALPGDRLNGRVVSVYPFVNAESRTLKARIEVANAGERLKPGMFAHVEVLSGSTEGVVIPADAVLDSGREPIVFVAQGNGYFEPRRVQIASQGNGEALVSSGLVEGELVVTRAAFLLDSESQLRAAVSDYRPKGDSPSSGGHGSGPLAAISVSSLADPASVGRNRVAVRVRAADGTPVTDADVRIICSMPAMPSMQMPAMRSDARLAHGEGDEYRGEVSLSMAGRWDVTITAQRAGAPLAELRTSTIAR